VTSHRVTVRGLLPSITHHLRAKGHDTAGNEPTQQAVSLEYQPASRQNSVDDSRESENYD
jgi:hypothetical protein